MHREDGLAGVSLVIIIGWALAAVLMLTGTLVAAQRIDGSVATITGEVSEIDKDLDAVALTQETNRIAADILTAAEPLSEQLDQVHAAALSIDQSAAAILSTAGEINTTVLQIGDTAGSINSTVATIQGNVNAILATARSINDGVAAINGRADVIIAAVQGIKSDTGNVLAQVREIDGHANSIDCSPALVASTGCVR